jgi:protease-4
MTDKKIGFGKIFWPSLIAALIVSILGSIIFLLITAGLISGFSDLKPEPFSVKENTVLHITLDGEISEVSDTKFNKSQLSFENKIGLSDLLFGFKNAVLDENIKGVFIDIKDVNCGYSTAKEIRQAINEFEKSGKFAIAYNSGEYVSQKEYYIASAANLNYGFPTTAMEFVGLGAELMFFKKTLEKLDVEMQVIRGKNNDFKSAVEPFFRENMSDSSRVQIEKYISSMWADIKSDIAHDRKTTIKQLNNIAENATIHRVEDGVKYKLIDAVKYRDEVIDILKQKSGLDLSEDLNLQSFEKYSKKLFYEDQTIAKLDEPNIAVILAEGEISTDGNGLTSKDICKLFQDVRKNKTIKTVVFRINSPGGSALASDEIWREVKLTNKKQKVIVSMGDVAASGGYYIAAPAFKIFAEPTTITGSIGVFGVIPFTGNLLTNKLGLTFDRAATNKHSVMSLNRRLTQEELGLIQLEVDQIYTQFMKNVSDGRKLTIPQVNAIARGRVWTGRDALKIGLVDELGGLTDAINYAAKNEGISNKKVLYYPLKEDDPISELIEKIEEETTSKNSKASTIELPVEIMNYYNQIKNLESYSGIQMRMPYQIDIR